MNLATLPNAATLLLLAFVLASSSVACGGGEYDQRGGAAIATEIRSLRWSITQPSTVVTHWMRRRLIASWLQAFPRTTWKPSFVTSSSRQIRLRADEPARTRSCRGRVVRMSRWPARSLARSAVSGHELAPWATWKPPGDHEPVQPAMKSALARLSCAVVLVASCGFDIDGHAHVEVFVVNDSAERWIVRLASRGEAHWWPHAAIEPGETGVVVGSRLPTDVVLMQPESCRVIDQVRVTTRPVEVHILPDGLTLVGEIDLSEISPPTPRGGRHVPGPVNTASRPR